MTVGRIRTIQRVLAGVALVASAMVFAAPPVGARQLPPNEPLFVTASVDNERPFIGQQITYVSRIYQRSDISRSLHYEPPGFAGFWNVKATEQDEFSETIYSREYRVIELRTILFPGVVETIEIEPGVLTVSASASEGPIVVESVPVMVEVRPTPEDAPAGFTGAVGTFNISAEVDTATARMNETVQLTVKIQGMGNIDALPAPSWPEFQGWRVIQSLADAGSEVIDGILLGSRTYENVLVPETAGELTIPEISYAYYDPDKEEYVEATTSPIVVTIAEADGAPSLPPSSVDGTKDERTVPGAKRIRPVPLALRKPSGDMTDSVVYWAMWSLPLLAIAGAALWRRRRDAWEAALVDSRRRNALANAQSTLARAAAGGDDHSIAAADAVLSYLSNRLRLSLGGLTREELVQRLRDGGVPNEVAEQVEDTLASGEASRYTPEAQSAGPTGDRIERAGQLLAELDGVIEV